MLLIWRPLVVVVVALGRRRLQNAREVGMIALSRIDCIDGFVIGRDKGISIDSIATFDTPHGFYRPAMDSLAITQLLCTI